jgi:hypothetical protein
VALDFSSLGSESAVSSSTVDYNLVTSLVVVGDLGGFDPLFAEVAELVF